MKNQTKTKPLLGYPLKGYIRSAVAASESIIIDNNQRISFSIKCKLLKDMKIYVFFDSLNI
jgi:hypothetical protein